MAAAGNAARTPWPPARGRLRVTPAQRPNRWSRVWNAQELVHRPGRLAADPVLAEIPVLAAAPRRFPGVLKYVWSNSPAKQAAS